MYHMYEEHITHTAYIVQHQSFERAKKRQSVCHLFICSVSCSKSKSVPPTLHLRREPIPRQKQARHKMRTKTTPYRKHILIYSTSYGVFISSVYTYEKTTAVPNKKHLLIYAVVSTAHLLPWCIPGTYDLQGVKYTVAIYVQHTPYR